MVSIAKSMGNGYPIGAVICRREIAEAFSKTGIEYFNTCAGNSVGVSIAEAVLDTVLAENLQQNALNVGQYLLTNLKRLMKFDVVGDIRGIGLFIGIEIIEPRGDKSDPKPNTKLTAKLVDSLMKDRVIVSKDGPYENVIKIKPPLVFSQKDADQLIEALERALKREVEHHNIEKL